MLAGLKVTVQPQSQMSYTFTDSNVVPGHYQYRLRQIDFDGSFTYSDIIEIEVEAPMEFSLEQNYPNPFNPSTKIKYVIPNVETKHALSQQMVSLKVYDILGNEIATVANEEKPAGSYEVEFNIHSDEGQNLVSGVYFYKLQAGSFIQTKRMILLK